ncbi:hypothetical protein DFH08DRAFT_866885 [Mycena albidolilacea]|uniref:Uncharacterized protein n=1 Tax=Mycena albidolilacea TaxID=1033008 RepID=A0AAD7ERY3_9AGAR|nr:hypothetical protein DFH08DRAFT_866885 [Mycena albidolilacea]
MSTTRSLRASTIANSFKVQMSRKAKSTPASSPLRPGATSAATIASSKDASPDAAKPQPNSMFGEHLAHDYPDAEYWVSFDNTISRNLIRYFDSDALPTSDTSDFVDTLQRAKPHFIHYRSSYSQPPLEVERFLYTVYKVAAAVKSKFPKPFKAPKNNPGQDLSFYLRLKPSADVMQALKLYANGARIALDASFGILQVDVRTPTPPYRPRDPLDDSEDEDLSCPALGKGKGKAASAARCVQHSAELRF